MANQLFKTLDKNGNVKVYCPFPVGTVLQNCLSSFDPNTLYTGTSWERYAQGRVLVGVNENDADFKTAGKSGGSKSHLHSLTKGYAKLTNSGTYLYYRWKATENYTSNWGFGKADMYSNAYGQSVASGIELGGTTDGTSNLSPYITVYMWRRTA